MSRPRPLRVALIGTGFMGAAHSHAWRTAPHVFDLPPVDRSVICGRDPQRTREAATKLGWLESSVDWREVVARDDIDIVDICTVGETHAEMAEVALAAGKHVICEKPLANTVEEAQRMTRAAQRAQARGVMSMVAFNYRRVPALAYARELISQGRLGEVRHVRAQYLQDWIVDPDFPLVWRLQKDKAGSGALGDIGAHVIDAAEYLTGQRIDRVSAMLHTFVSERPLAENMVGLSGTGGADRGEVTVDDAALIHATLSGGAIAAIEATRFATGRKNSVRIEINGSRGSVAFDFESMNELLFHDADLADIEGGFRRIYVTEPDHPYAGAWWPPGHGLGYDHTFVHEIVDFVRAIQSGTPPTPSFAEGLHVQRVLEAVEASARTGSTWTAIDQDEEGRS